MKILHLANHAEKIGNGIVNVMVDLACLQAEAGHDVAVVSSGGSYESLLRQHGAQHITLVQTKHPWRVPTMLQGFGKIVNRFQPDIVHAHMITGALLAKFGRGRRPYALITTVHNEFQKASDLMRLGDQVVAVSEAVARAMIERGIPSSRMSVVRNGIVGAPRFRERSDDDDTAAGLTLHHPNVVTVSGLYERKGIHDLLQACRQVLKRVPGMHLYMVGEGPDCPKLEALASRLGITERAHFEGYVTEPAPYYQQADVFVLPSHSETSSLAIMEAREAGCAIIGTAVGGIPETLDHGAAGVMVPAAAPARLADAIATLLENDMLRQHWQTRARQNLESLTAQRVYCEYQQIYLDTLARRAIPAPRPPRPAAGGR